MARPGRDGQTMKGFVASHRGGVMLGLIVVGIAAVTTFTIVTETGGTPDRRPATPATTAVGGPAVELARLVARGQAINVDVAYKGTTAATPPAFTAHLWRRGPLARLDNESGAGEGAVRSRQLVTASGPLVCTQTGSAPWSCTSKPDLSLGDLGVVSPALVKSLSAMDVSVRDDRTLGQAVRCFTVAQSSGAGVAPGETANLCLSSDGIPVRLDFGPTHLEAVSLDRGRPADSVFKPPA